MLRYGKAPSAGSAEAHEAADEALRQEEDAHRAHEELESGEEDGEERNRRTFGTNKEQWQEHRKKKEWRKSIRLKHRGPGNGPQETLMQAIGRQKRRRR